MGKYWFDCIRSFIILTFRAGYVFFLDRLRCMTGIRDRTIPFPHNQAIELRNAFMDYSNSLAAIYCETLKQEIAS